MARTQQKLMSGIFSQTAQILEKYFKSWTNPLGYDPRSREIKEIIKKLNDKTYEYLSKLNEDLDKAAAIPFSFPDNLLELIEEIKNMQRQEMNYKSYCLFNEEPLQPFVFYQALDAIGTQHKELQRSLLCGRNSSSISQILRDLPEANQADAIETLLKFIINLFLSEQNPSKANKDIIIKFLSSERYAFFSRSAQDNMLIRIIKQLKQFPPSLLYLCQFLGPDLAPLFWNNKEGKKASLIQRSALYYVLKHAPGSIPEFMSIINGFPIEEQIDIVHCAIFSGPAKAKSIFRKSSEYRIAAYERALEQLSVLKPHLKVPVWTGVLLQKIPEYNDSLFRFAIEHSSKTFHHIMGSIQELLPTEKVHFLSAKTIPLMLALNHESKEDNADSPKQSDEQNRVKVVLDAQKDLDIATKSIIYSRTNSSERNVLIIAGDDNSPYMADIREEIDNLPSHVIDIILNQIDLFGYSTLMASVTDWDIDSFEWYLAHIERWPIEAQLNVLNHSDKEDIWPEYNKEKRGYNALLLAIKHRFDNPRILTALFNFINKIIHRDAAKNVIDIATLINLLKRTDPLGRNALSMSLSNESSPNYAFNLVKELLLLIPASEQQELCSILLQETRKKMSPLLLAVKNHHQEAIQALLFMAMHTEPPCIIPMISQVNDKGENIMMIALRYGNKEALELLHQALSSFPLKERLELYGQLLSSTDKNGYNVLMLAVKHHPDLIPQTLEIIKQLPLEQQASIYKQLNNEGHNVLLLSTKLNRRHTHVTQAICNAIASLDELRPGTLREIKEQTQHKYYMDYVYPPTEEAEEETTTSSLRI